MKIPALGSDLLIFTTSPPGFSSGGFVSYDNFESLESDFLQKKLHPTDLKQSVGESLVKIVSPVREKLVLSDELSDLIKNNLVFDRRH